MKHFKKLLPLLVLSFAVLISFAFRTLEKKFTGLISCTYYTFIGIPGEEHDPSKYIIMNPQPTTWPVCANPNNVLCAICTGEIYTSGTHNGLPKVDDPTTSIYDNINTALTSPKSDLFITFGGDLITAVELRP